MTSQRGIECAKMITKKDYALNYFDNGLVPIPLCWVDGNRCGCFHHHTDPTQIGKAPLVKFTDSPIRREMVAEWFTRYPQANIGLLLKESGLVVIDCDSMQAVGDVESFLDPSLIPNVRTSRGKHYYFKANSNTPIYRSTGKGKSGKIDIFSNGYVVAPPSVHRNGHRYQWSNPPKQTGLPNVPRIIEQFLINEKQKHGAGEFIKIRINAASVHQEINLDDLPLNDFIKDLIKHGENSRYYHERGYQSRSELLFGVMIACLKSGLTETEICRILLDRRNGISHKVLEQKKSLAWLTKEIKKAKKKAVLQTT